VLAAVPVALVVGLLRTHLAHGAVATLLLALERLPASAVRDALARALRDPSVEVAFWVPDQRGYVDPDGRPVPSPTETDERAVIHLSHEDDRIAAISHDPALGEDPELVESVAAAARLALENARLHAELRAQLAAVQESRARIAAAADAERRRIEQDLHDGAQQRLVAVALDLRAAERRLGDRIDPELRAVFRSAVDELQGAVDELRELAHGVHPSILRQEGLGAALDALAVRAPLPVRVEAAVDGRLAPDVEAAAYFVACEALTNAVKHAGATSATVRAVRDDGFLVVEVEDDGLGGADATRGSGLRGLLDRVEARGGDLRVVSPPGRGTRVVGRIPCGS
jgi:signal transduction histidine kinase